MTAPVAGAEMVRSPMADQVPAPVAPALGDLDYVQEVRRVTGQVKAIHAAMKDIMELDIHYGVIPGTDKDRLGSDGKKMPPKQTLYQPGADILCMLFRLRCEFSDEGSIERDDFLLVKSICRLYHIDTGKLVAEGRGTCNTRESKYTSRTTSRTCPRCSVASIYASNRPGEEGWYCWAKKGGCGAKYEADDPAIVGQDLMPKTEAVWDLHNTVTKLSNKRAKMAAILTATGAGSIFAPDDEGPALDPDRTADDGEPGDKHSPAQWDQITALQKTIGINTAKLWAEYITGLVGRDHLKDLTRADAETVIKAMRDRVVAHSGQNPTPTTKPGSLKEAAERAKAERVKSAAPASTDVSVEQLEQAITKAGMPVDVVLGWEGATSLEGIPAAKRASLLKELQDMAK